MEHTEHKEERDHHLRMMEYHFDQMEKHHESMMSKIADEKIAEHEHRMHHLGCAKMHEDCAVSLMEGK